jgi:SAM-dependent methyltransferase
MSEAQRERLVVNVGCGPRGASSVPAHFATWKELRVDNDPAVEPDLLADLTDLSAIADGSVDAVWAAHCVEHLYAHQVSAALAEFRRVVRDDGFVCVIVPDLQIVAQYIANDQLHQPLYKSSAGPVTPHDVVFGFGPAIANGRGGMAHRCGFTPGMLQQYFQQSHFGEVLLRRRSAQFELAALARAIPAKDDAERTVLVNALQL